MKQFVAGVAIVACVAAGLWHYRRLHQERTAATAVEQPETSDQWLDRLYSQNPKEAAAAAKEVEALGDRALPAIQAVLDDPQSEAEHLKAALKAAGLLGKRAAPIVDDVAAVLPEPGLTAEAALALSQMGRDAFPPLRQALNSPDPMVRREALRSIGKLQGRAPLDSKVVVPLLIARMKDPDAGVRAVAATYLGIVHQGNDSVRALIAGLADEDDEVRRSSAAALGSFGAAAGAAMPALKKATRDRNPDVAREAGQAIVRLQQK